MEGPSLIDFFVFILFVFVNGFFVASEFAFVKVRKTKIDELVAKGSRRAKTVSKIVSNLDRLMTTTQLGVTLASIAIALVGEPFFDLLFNPLFNGFNNLVGRTIFSVKLINTLSFLLSYFVVSYMHVVIGELTPKNISIQLAERVALFCAEPLWLFMRITSPILSFFVWSSNKLLKLVKVQPQSESREEVYSEKELKIIIHDSIEAGEIEAYESRLIFNILDFTDSSVRGILTPRIDIRAVPSTVEAKTILDLSVQTGYSRFPVYKEKFDDMIGFVHIKDVIKYSNGFGTGNNQFDVTKIIRPMITVPENKPLDDLLKKMQALKTQMSIIVNEYGEVEGLVSIEDVLEAIVGPIDDEFDPTQIRANIIERSDKIIAGGLVSIEQFNAEISDKFGVEIEPKESATLAGYILELFESEIPSEGNSITDEDFQYQITKLSGNRIAEIQVIKLKQPKTPKENGK